MKGSFSAVAAMLVVVCASQGAAFAQGIGVGVKGGVVAPNFSTEVFDPDDDRVIARADEVAAVPALPPDPSRPLWMSSLQWNCT